MHGCPCAPWEAAQVVTGNVAALVKAGMHVPVFGVSVLLRGALRTFPDAHCIYGRCEQEMCCVLHGSHASIRLGVGGVRCGWFAPGGGAAPGVKYPNSNRLCAWGERRGLLTRLRVVCICASNNPDDSCDGWNLVATFGWWSALLAMPRHRGISSTRTDLLLALGSLDT